jgi:hypothetical protein
MKKGAKTNRSGKPLEHALEQLRQNGFAHYKGRTINYVKIFPQKYVITHAPYITIYGTKGYHEGHIVADSQNGEDFVPESNGKIQIIIECKFQSGSGSTDEKIPYVIESFSYSDIKNWVLILNGGWWSKKGRGTAAVSYAKMQALKLSDSGKKLFVVSRYEFTELVLNAWGNKPPQVSAAI